MKLAAKHTIVLVTAPNLRIARRLAQAALGARLAACANLVPSVESHYWWQGKLENAKEVLIVLKTSTTRLAELEQMIIAKHPYDTPEFLALPLKSGTKRYLAWLDQCLR